MTMDDSRELKLELTLDAPRAKIWRCWTESDLLKQWFTPKPWSTLYADLDVRPGGRMNVTMRSPEGEEILSTGVYLVPDRKPRHPNGSKGLEGFPSDEELIGVG
jgi:uncharacterized protein YndB with AHSA1/START domain